MVSEMPRLTGSMDYMAVSLASQHKLKLDENCSDHSDQDAKRTHSHLGQSPSTKPIKV